MTEKKKNALVLWSGGADSTLVLWDLLRGGEYESVHALTVDYYNVGAGKEQTRARKVIRAWLRRKGLKFLHTQLDIHPNIKIQDFGITSGGLQQPGI